MPRNSGLHQYVVRRDTTFLSPRNRRHGAVNRAFFNQVGKTVRLRYIDEETHWWVKHTIDIIKANNLIGKIIGAYPATGQFEVRFGLKNSQTMNPTYCDVDVKPYEIELLE
mgnify:CR=1 FL=1